MQAESIKLTAVPAFLIHMLTHLAAEGYRLVERYIMETEHIVDSFVYGCLIITCRKLVVSKFLVLFSRRLAKLIFLMHEGRLKVSWSHLITPSRNSVEVR
jgi:hypothetical protein